MQLSTVVQLQNLTARRLRMQRQHPRLAPLQARRPGGLRLPQACAQIGGVMATLHIGLGQCGARQLRIQRLLLQPVEKVVGRLGEGAHAPGRHVQQVLGAGRRIGHALRQRRLRFDQLHAQRGAGLAQQLQRDQHAGRAAADDGDVAVVGGRFAGHKLIHAAIVREAPTGPARG
ncbi:hypothetical protein NB689_003340 [Xanthomonas sacchari]|nr:hypothetical protein [Xanthomonas sacchari]